MYKRTATGASYLTLIKQTSKGESKGGIMFVACIPVLVAEVHERWTGGTTADTLVLGILPLILGRVSHEITWKVAHIILVLRRGALLIAKSMFSNSLALFTD